MFKPFQVTRNDAKNFEIFLIPYELLRFLRINLFMHAKFFLPYQGFLFLSNPILPLHDFIRNIYVTNAFLLQKKMLKNDKKPTIKR